MFDESTTVRANVNGVPITRHAFAPNGASHKLQAGVTQLMHKLCMAEGKFTLAELGYMHINTVTYDQSTGELHLRVYFDIRMAARAKKSSTSKTREIVPVQELKIFQNYLFVGDLNEAITYEKIMAPKMKVSGDELNRPSLQFKDGGKFIETDVLVINCNLAITMAAMLNISLEDPEFAVKCETVGKGSKKAVKGIISTVSVKEVPVAVTIEHSDQGLRGYDPEFAVPYLVGLQEKLQRIAKNRNKLGQKVRKDAKTKKEQSAAESYKGFNKYS